MFYGYVDNGNEFVKFKIKKDSAREAWAKLMDMADKVSDTREDFQRIEWVRLEDENGDYITDWEDDIKRNLEEYDRKYSKDDRDGR